LLVIPLTRPYKLELTRSGSLYGWHANPNIYLRPGKLYVQQVFTFALTWQNDPFYRQFYATLLFILTALISYSSGSELHCFFNISVPPCSRTLKALIYVPALIIPVFVEIIMDESTYKYTFTVFTPTFNRVQTLFRVYESLRKQTFLDFEWLIVDDGSTDNSRKCIESWQKQAYICIRYFWQPHQGKHIAFNYGVREAQGKFFLNLDSDDICVPEALERFKHFWDSIPESKRNQFSAVTVLCKDQNGRLIGKKFPQDIIDSDSLEIFYKYKLKGEKWGFHRTEVLKEFPFPIINSVNFVPESIIWNAIARKFQTRFVNEPLRIYFKKENRGSEQLSRPNKPSAQAAAYLLSHSTVLNGEIDYFLFRPKHFFVSALQYARYSFHTGSGILKQIKGLANSRATALWVVMLPGGLLVFWGDKVLRR
jgi:glycosyltransferase involved in cell wall biosynthesis